MPQPPTRRLVIAGFALAALVTLLIFADGQGHATRAVFQGIAHLFYEQSGVAELRAASQFALFRAHLLLVLAGAALALIAAPALSPHARRVCALLLVGYAIRAAFWIAGGNLPLVPGDSCHYVEVATSILRGEGPVKHYVESFFVDYTKVGFNAQGAVLDDWATPLWAYLLAACYRILGVVPGASLEATFAVAKGASFVLNVATLPVLYGLARRWFGRDVAMVSLALLAVLPVHAIYAGLELRESLVAFTSVVAAWAFFEMLGARGAAALAWGIAAGIAAGLAILARNTSLVLVASMGVFGLFTKGQARIVKLMIWAVACALVIAPWAWITWQTYGEPFFSYTKYYPYNFSWTVHHFDRGNTAPAQFFTATNLPSIARVKLKSIVIVILYSAMILSPPVVLGYFAAFRAGLQDTAKRYARFTALTFLAFLAATLIQISDVTQVQQLGRYYLPVYVLMAPVGAAGLAHWARGRLGPRGVWALGLVIVGALWSNMAWAYDATWYTSDYQLRWPALRAAGTWIRENPGTVPSDARIITWFPWELRVASDRTTVLFPRALEAGPYELERLSDTIRKYQVTHVLWGSFEPSASGEPEALGRYLEGLRSALGLTESEQIWKSERLPHPVRLYRLPATQR